MKSFQCFKILFLFCTLFSEINILAKKHEPENPKKQGSFTFKTENFLFSRDFLVSCFTHHPLLSTGIVNGAIWASLYPEHLDIIKNTLTNKDYRNTLFAASSTLALLCYLKRKAIIQYLNPEEKTEEDEEEGGYAQFSKSGVKIYLPSEIKTTFEDVAGLQSAKEDLADILCFLTEPEKFEEIGAHVPKGVLLSGPPGNGKTLLARALAGEVQCPFLYINASSLIETFVGMGAARIRSLFTLAKKLAPCIIFMDEIDSIGRKRSTYAHGGESELTQTLNQLLSEMDGFEQQEFPIIVIAATNRAQVLDDALMRPGRFDRTVAVNRPYIKDRCEILKIYFNKVKTTDDINIEKIACGTPNFSSADLANLVNEAAILAVRAGKLEVSMAEVDQARDFMLMGRETKGMDASQEDFWETAIHESGHAIATVYQKDATPLYKVTITARGHALGITHFMDSKEYYSQHENELRAEIIVSLAGSVAEEIILHHRGVGARQDLSYARQLATAMVMHYGMTEEFKDVSFIEYVDNQVHLPNDIATKLHEEIAKIINECRIEAIKIINEHQTELLQLSEMLMEQKTVSGEQVYKLCGIEEPELQFNLNS